MFVTQPERSSDTDISQYLHNYFCISQLLARRQQIRISNNAYKILRYKSTTIHECCFALMRRTRNDRNNNSNIMMIIIVLNFNGRSIVPSYIRVATGSCLLRAPRAQYEELKLKIVSGVGFRSTYAAEILCYFVYFFIFKVEGSGLRLTGWR